MIIHWVVITEPKLGEYEMDRLDIVKLNDIAQAGINYLINNKRDLDGLADAIRLHALDVYNVKLTWGEALAIAEVI